MTTYTPAPWHYDDKQKLKDSEGNFILPPNDASFLHHDKRDANRALIAAAPDLLEALEIIEAAITCPAFDILDRERREKQLQYCAKHARAAIAKAKGEI